MEEEDLNSSTEKEGVEVFFFPDESNMRQKHTSSETIERPIEDDKTIDNEVLLMGVLEEAIEAKPTNAQVAKDLGDPTSTSKSSPKKSKRKKVKSHITRTEIKILNFYVPVPGESKSGNELFGFSVYSVWLLLLKFILQ